MKQNAPIDEKFIEVKEAPVIVMDTNTPVPGKSLLPKKELRACKEKGLRL